MKILLSPAKTQQLNGIIDPILDDTIPKFHNEAGQLYQRILSLSLEELQVQYKLSDKKAIELYQLLHTEVVQEVQSLIGYNGIVYKYIDVSNWNIQQHQFAQQYTYIFSALYGLLKTTDIVKPYRLDMTHHFIFGDVKSTVYWKDKLATVLQDEDLLINLASDEFTKYLSLPNLLTIEFLTLKDGSYKKINTYVKMARGKMYDIIINQEITTKKQLQEITFDGYCFNQELSSEEKFVYTRETSE